MVFWEILLLAVGLSMDAFAVAVCRGLAFGKAKTSEMVRTGLWFGGFQALMPVIGYFLAKGFQAQIDKYDHWISFGLLLIIGLNMIREALGGEDEAEEEAEEKKAGTSDTAKLFVLAIATSIDALAVGVTFAFVPVSLFGLSGQNKNTFIACAIIGCITFGFSASGVKIGSVFGDKYKEKAELTGGVILICLGIKILLQGLGVI